MRSPAEPEPVVAGQEPVAVAEPPATGARPRWQGLVLAAVPGAVAVGVSATALVLATDLDVRDARYPAALAVVLLVIGGWSLVGDLLERRALASDDDAVDEEYGRLDVGRVAPFVALVAVCVYLMTPFGFYPAVAILVVGGMWIMGVRHPVALLGYPVVVVAVAYVLFARVLLVPLPLGQGF